MQLLDDVASSVVVMLEEDMVRERYGDTRDDRDDPECAASGRVRRTPYYGRTSEPSLAVSSETRVFESPITVWDRRVLSHATIGSRVRRRASPSSCAPAAYVARRLLRLRTRLERRASVVW